MSQRVSRTPWSVEEDEGGLFVMDADGYEVARLQTAHKMNAAADAPILAAAPDLLKAAEGALVWVALATARNDEGARAVENAKADLLALQLAITRAGGIAGRGIDEAARAAIAAVEGGAQ